MKIIFNSITRIIVGAIILGAGIGIPIGIIFLIERAVTLYISNEITPSFVFILHSLVSLISVVVLYAIGELILESDQHKDKYADMANKDLEELHIRIINEIEYRNTHMRGIK